ncbi:hypothetical protein JUN65_00445 [Gluconacetobacter azotocaptans]|uniref:hypothetical protein n=1 Tax=Gluconacetobacter azotocaptans TaxID=142834 RepID=UPI00195C2A86|nr:hypothetical protein [Gluconacetobacter azotocaptans]MBM9400066.1 hypothetical protein [Gluconacetobacter azotocaptans]
MTDIADAVTKEIVELHRLLQAWFCGEGTNDPEVILERFDPGYMMVGAAGRVVSYEDFQKILPALHGSRPTLVMQISDVRVCHTFEGGVLAFYREVQTTGESCNARWSSVMFLFSEDGQALRWRHLHETFVA